MFENIEDERISLSFIPAYGRRLPKQRLARYRATHKYQHDNFMVFALLSTLLIMKRIVENDVCCHVVAALISAQPPHSVHSSPCTLLLLSHAGNFVVAQSTTPFSSSLESVVVAIYDIRYFIQRNFCIVTSCAACGVFVFAVPRILCSRSAQKEDFANYGWATG